MSVATQTQASPQTLECTLCRTRHRVRNLRVLRHGATASCRHCGAAFIAVRLPDPPPPLAESPPRRRPAGAPLRPAPDGADPARAAVAASEAPHRVRRFSFNGQGASLFGIQIVNMFLTLLTLGLYYFWAKVRIRRYLFSQTECEGDRFAYHGTGRELLTGFLKAALVFGVPYFLLGGLPELLELDQSVRMTAGWAAGLLVFLFIPVAIVSARRYRCSRTSWRGIRFSFRGRVWDFMRLSGTGSLLTTLTLGAYYPYYQVRRHRYLTAHTYFGSQALGFDGEAAPLVPAFTTALLLTPVLAVVVFALPWWSGIMQHPGMAVLYALAPYALLALLAGPLWIWFLAKKQRYFWNCTSLGPARCRCTVTGRKLLNLKVENLLLLVLTLGTAWPWVTVRTTRFYLDNLALEGPVDLDAIQQDARAAQTTGEGLADMLDIGFDIDF